MGITFTLHAQERIRQRNISLQDVIDAISTTRSETKQGKSYCIKQLRTGTIEVVYIMTGSDIKVITVYWV